MAEARGWSTIDPPSDEVQDAPASVTLDLVRRARRNRRGLIVLILAILTCGAVGLFGGRNSTVTRSANGYELSVTYAKVGRPGTAAPWSAVVRREGGFRGPVVVATSSSYLDLFDENGLDPDPRAVTTDAERVIWTFDPPPGDTLTISLDGLLEPSWHIGRHDGRTQVLVGGKPVVEVRYRTWTTP